MIASKAYSSLFAALALVALSAVMVGACAAGSDEPTIEDDAGGPGTTPGDATDGVCLLNGCHSDQECVGCTDGRDTCLVAENRCVACDPNTGDGCPDGMTCSSWGICAPNGQECPTDGEGNPTISCAQNSDCLACSPMNQVCNEGKCQACTPTNTQHCSQSDICVDGECSDKCPSACTADNDCSQCGAPGSEAHACFQHKCAECSSTFPCAQGEECKQGKCVAPCGIPGPVAGGCDTDDDCQFCGDGASGDYVCKKQAINDDHGKCVPQAAGCSDLGSGVAVMPEPWNSVTETCSNDNDCNGVSLDYNVGELVRDLVGDDEIDLGFTEIEIHDAYVGYGMGECAAIEITGEISCGVCVPCKVDTDCEPIGLDPLLAQMFSSDPLALIASSVLIDLLFGNNGAHELHFFCQDVAGGYGVCVPCGNPLQSCGGGSSSGGGDHGGGSCDHDECDEGGALDASCGVCAGEVCANDSYCCDTAWDDICVGEVDQYCTQSCSGSGGGGCIHDEYDTGVALNAGCSSCAADICSFDPYCCNTQWDQTCVDEANQECGGGGGSSCSHDECDEGGALNSSCSWCAGDVCAADPYCCNNDWDATCVEEAESICGYSCGGGGGSSCAHDECVSGGALNSSCSWCAYDVCDYDSYCCTTAWDSYCVDAAENTGSCNYCF